MSVLSYERSFHDSYKVMYGKALLTDTIKDMSSANFIPAAFRKTYYGYSRGTCLSLRYEICCHCWIL